MHFLTTNKTKNLVDMIELNSYKRRILEDIEKQNYESIKNVKVYRKSINFLFFKKSFGKIIVEITINEGLYIAELLDDKKKIEDTLEVYYKYHGESTDIRYKYI